MTVESSRRQAEQELLELVSRLLKRYEKKLSAVGLQTGEVALQRWDDSSRPRSEITISLLEGVKLYDVIEFFVWDAGCAIAGETVVDGMKDELDDAIGRRHRNDR